MENINIKRRKSVRTRIMTIIMKTFICWLFNRHIPILIEKEIISIRCIRCNKKI